MKALLALIKKLYGSKAIQKTIGTRTNVITLPDKDTKRFVTNELNIEAASDAAVKKAFEDAEKLIPDIPKMNDQEILTLTGNLRRLDNRINPPEAPSAEVIEFGTKKPVSPAGIKQLEAERGLPADVDPNSPLGRIMQRVKKVELEGKDLAKEFGMTDELKKGMEGLSTEGGIPFQMGDVKGKASADELFDMITKNPYRSGGPLDPSSGIVRTAARQILRKKLDAGEIDIPDAAERDAIAKGYQGGVDPIEVFRKRFGEDPLQDLDEIADELNRAGDFKEIDDILKRNKLFDIEPKKDYGYQEGVMTDEELRKVLEKADVDPDDTGFKDGGRVGFAYGSGLKLLKLLNKKGTDLKKEIKKAVDDLNPTGNKKLDADMAVDNMLEDLNIDRDAIDQYDILNAYDEAYKQISNPASSIGVEEISNLKNIGAPKMAERIEIMQKYPGIDPKLVDKILIDDNPQRKAEVLATLDEAFRMMEKGMGSDEILQTFKKTPRTKQAGGGLAYLMGL